MLSAVVGQAAFISRGIPSDASHQSSGPKKFSWLQSNRGSIVPTSCNQLMRQRVSRRRYPNCFLGHLGPLYLLKKDQLVTINEEQR